MISEKQLTKRKMVQPQLLSPLAYASLIWKKSWINVLYSPGGLVQASTFGIYIPALEDRCLSHPSAHYGWGGSVRLNIAFGI